MSVVASRIDFHQLAKPANLKNSAVLRMLEEEEHRQRNGQPPSLKQVVWPPPQDETEAYNGSEQPSETQGGPLHYSQTSPQPVHHQAQPQHNPGHHQQPVSPQPFSAPQQPKGWAPVLSPVLAPAHQPSYQPHPTQAFRPVVPEPPPSLITLRPSPPISQAPAPVYTSQPYTATLKGGINMRGDQKWPPASVKAQAEEENEKRKLLAKGPVFRPRRVKKDYSSFFAQHALNSTYPGYKAPPGTQHYTEENQGVSHY